MLIWALDLGTHAGYAVLNDGKVIKSGVKDFTPPKKFRAMRFIDFREWLMDEVTDSTGLIVYELPHHRGGAATRVLLGLVAIVEMVACEKGIEVKSVQTRHLKKWATGKGNAEKSEMVLASRKRTGIMVTDDNEADAILVGLWAASGEA